MLNPYSSFLLSEVKQLVEKCESVSHITHNPTKGALREAYLRAFLSKIVPQQCSLSGGFITDIRGTLTPQIDLIGYDNSLPAMKLDQSISIVPIEATRFWIEVKSTLETKHLDGVVERLNEIDKMECSLLDGNEPRFFKPSLFPCGLIVACENKVSENTLKDWANRYRSLVAVIVVGKLRIWNLSNDANSTEFYKSNGSYDETLFLAAKLHQIFTLACRHNEHAMNGWSLLPRNPSQEDIEAVKEKFGDIDGVHYSLQTYLEAEGLLEPGPAILPTP